MKKQKEKHRNKRKLKLIFDKKSIMIVLGILTVMYLCVSVFFTNHFYFGSQINDIDVSIKNINQVERKILSDIGEYSLEIVERGGDRKKISGKDIGLEFNQKNKIIELKNNQNPFKWINSIFSKSKFKIDEIVTFDQKYLNEKLSELYFSDSKGMIKPKDVSFQYVGNGYTMIEEVYGNKIKKDVLYENVKNSILKGKNILNLEEANCYENPKFTSKSKEAIEAMELLNTYINAKITYNLGDKKEVIDCSTINKWLYVDENMKVAFNNKLIRKYIDSMAAKYNTFGKTRTFAASTGKKVQVSGGNYGWIISRSEEVKSLIEAIKNGKDTIKEPVYSQKAVLHGSNDIGNTYVEINLTRQHLWYYKNGSLVTEGDVVTGNTSKKLGTPTGTYRLNYKAKKTKLKGTNYCAEVDFWMPFNNNIGIHDAKWRTEFGKDIYTQNGSHGCINSPYTLANILFNNIVSGTPVICYTE